MTRLTKILSFSVPPVLADEVKQIAQEEKRTNSELFREMLRVYRAYRKKQPEPAIDEAWALQLIREAQEEELRAPLSAEEFATGVKRAQRYGAKRLNTLGITTEEQLNDMLYAERKTPR